jgi:predicted TIM-barrel fold metal-dependent hydrolase
MYCDGHVHLTAKTTGKDVLKAMDAQEMEKIILIGPHMTGSNEEIVEAIGIIADVCSADPDRLRGLAWISPVLSGAVQHVEMAINDRGLRGIKMIPDHWYPYEERLFPVYARIEELRKPILFHSGILFGNMDSSRFCRPVFFEVMLHFPRLKFTLAHIAWPWTDECIAVVGRMRAAVHRGIVDQMQMYVDITRGTPAFYRSEALDKALKYIGPERLIFGSDDRVPGDLSKSKGRVLADRYVICEELGYSEEAYRGISRDNIEGWLTPMD